MDMAQEVLRLIDAVRALEDRVRELESSDGDSSPRVGFEIDVDDDFDEDDSEY